MMEDPTEKHDSLLNDEIETEDAPLHIVLYEPEIAANVGAIGRTCVGLGAKLWMVEPLGFQISDRKLKRAGLDYWPYLNWEVVPDWTALLGRLGPERSGKVSRRFFYFSKRGARSFDEISYRLGDVFVFGAESRGLPESLLSDELRTLRIPIRSQIRSLNISVSVAIAGFEARRQLRFNEG